VRVLIVIVNFRAGPFVVECLQSLAAEVRTFGGCRVVVTDNASDDGSVELLAREIERRGFADFATLMPLPKNGGFAWGNNAAIAKALAGSDPPDYVFLLNPDTWIRPGAVRTLVEYLDAHPDVAMAGSRLEDADGTPQHSRFRFPCIRSELDDGLRLGFVHRLFGDHVTCPDISDTPHPIDWLSGAAMLVRRTVFERVGLLDEGFFLYFEELDFCRRAHDMGFRCHYVPQSRIVHVVGQSTGVTVRGQRPARRPRYWYESRQRYFRKHHSRVYRLFCDLAFAGGLFVWKVRSVLQRKANQDPPHLLRDFVRHNFWFG
jgi:hypothetical protein